MQTRGLKSKAAKKYKNYYANDSYTHSPSAFSAIIPAIV
jgi:hypothetical protein